MYRRSLEENNNITQNMKRKHHSQRPNETETPPSLLFLWSLRERQKKKRDESRRRVWSVATLYGFKFPYIKNTFQEFFFDKGTSKRENQRQLFQSLFADKNEVNPQPEGTVMNVTFEGRKAPAAKISTPRESTD